MRRAPRWLSGPTDRCSRSSSATGDTLGRGRRGRGDRRDRTRTRRRGGQSRSRRLVEERLAAHGVTDAVTVGGWNGWRLRALVGSGAEGARPGRPRAGGHAHPRLAPRPGARPPCPGVSPPFLAAPAPTRPWSTSRAAREETYGSCTRCGAERPRSSSPGRRAAHGRKRAAIATAGPENLADAVGAALARAPAWPPGESISSDPWPAADERTLAYDASRARSRSGGARIVVTARTSSPERAVAVSSELGSARGPLRFPPGCPRCARSRPLRRRDGSRRRGLRGSHDRPVRA